MLNPTGCLGKKTQHKCISHRYFQIETFTWRHILTQAFVTYLILRLHLLCKTTDHTLRVVDISLNTSVTH